MAETISLIIDAKDKASDILGKVGGGLTSLAGIAGGVVVAGLGAMTAAMVDGIAGAMDLDEAMGQFSAQTGYTGKSLDEFEDIARELFTAGWGESIGDVAAAMADVQSITSTSGDELEALTENALVLADAFDKDVNESVRAVDGAMIAFGADGEQVFDYIAAAIKETGDPADDLLDTINEYSADFAEAGFSISDMFDILVSGTEAGVFNMDKVADSVREFSTRVVDGSDSSKAALEAIGISADDLYAGFKDGSVSVSDSMTLVIESLETMDDPIAQDAAGVALFGSLWEDLGKDAIFAIGGMTSELEEVPNAINQSASALQRGLGPAWERIKRTVMDTLGQALSPFVEKLAELAEEWGPVVADWIENTLAPALEDATVWIMDNLIPALGEMWRWFSEHIIPAIAEVWAWIEENLLPAFAGLTEGGGELTDSLKQVYDWFADNVLPILKEVAAWLMDNLIPVIAEVGGFYLEIGGKIVGWIQENWPLIQKTIETVMEAIWSVVSAILEQVRIFWEQHGEKIMAFVDKMWNTIKTVIETILSTIGHIVKAIMLAIQGDWEGAWMEIQDAAEEIWEAIKAIVDTALEALKLWLSIAMDYIQELWETAWTWIQDKADEIWESIKLLIDTAIQWVRDQIDSTLSTISNLWETVWAGIEQFAQDTWDSIVLAVAQWILDFIAAFQDTWDSIVQIGADLVEKIKTGISDTWHTILDAVESWITDVVDGFMDFVDDLWDVGSEVVAQVKAGISGTWQTIIDGIGGWIDKLIGNAGAGTGFLGAVAGVVSVGQAIVDAIEQGISNAWQSFVDWLIGLVQGIIGEILALLGIGGGAQSAGLGLTFSPVLAPETPLGGGMTIYGDVYITAESEEGRSIIRELMEAV